MNQSYYNNMVLKLGDGCPCPTPLGPSLALGPLLHSGASTHLSHCHRALFAGLLECHGSRFLTVEALEFLKSLI